LVHEHQGNQRKKGERCRGGYWIEEGPRTINPAVATTLERRGDMSVPDRIGGGGERYQGRGTEKKQLEKERWTRKTTTTKFCRRGIKVQ